MQENFDTNTPKKPTNLTINSDLLRIAKTLKINISATLEEALIQKVRVQKQNVWLEENKQAIESYNDFVDKNGTFSDHVRKF